MFSVISIWCIFSLVYTPSPNIHCDEEDHKKAGYKTLLIKAEDPTTFWCTFTRLHGIITQKPAIFTFATVENSNVAKILFRVCFTELPALKQP